MKLTELFKEKEERPTCSAVILSAGNSTRMGEDKTLMELDGIPVLIRSALAFEHSEYVDEIIIVTQEEKIEAVADLCHSYHLKKLTMIIKGGASRMESSLNGVSNVKKDAKLIAIHDAARPLVTEAVISATVQAAALYYAAIPVVPSTDTLRKIRKDTVTAHVDRSCVYRVQTPQVFSADLIKGALTHAVTKNIDVTDDSSAMELMGVKIHTVPGDERNLKLTTKNDVAIAKAFLAMTGEKT